MASGTTCQSKPLCMSVALNRRKSKPRKWPRNSHASGSDDLSDSAWRSLHVSPPILSLAVRLRAMSDIQCLVVTPEKTQIDVKSTSVTVPLFDGEMGILRGH
ncbi:MAG TPA: hypothetical protein DCF63_12565, partial [Planctomycetaceae bacterium]|nr:hypothetical protein [Planctomycetaceae bacterium]